MCLCGPHRSTPSHLSEKRLARDNHNRPLPSLRGLRLLPARGAQVQVAMQPLRDDLLLRRSQRESVIEVIEGVVNIVLRDFVAKIVVHPPFFGSVKLMLQSDRKHTWGSLGQFALRCPLFQDDVRGYLHRSLRRPRQPTPIPRPGFVPVPQTQWIGAVHWSAHHKLIRVGTIDIERGRAMLATIMLRISPAKSRRGTRPRVRRSAGIDCRVLTLVNGQRTTTNEQPRETAKPRVYCGTNAGPSELRPAAGLGFRNCFSYGDHHSHSKDANSLDAWILTRRTGNRKRSRIAAETHTAQQAPIFHHKGTRTVLAVMVSIFSKHRCLESSLHLRFLLVNKSVFRHQATKDALR